MPVLLKHLDHDLALPAANDSKTRLRILVVKGMVARNYDAATAFNVWQEVRRFAIVRQELLLPMQALGEEGLQAFILGRASKGCRDMAAAYLFARYSGDKAAYVTLCLLLWCWCRAGEEV